MSFHKDDFFTNVIRVKHCKYSTFNPLDDGIGIL